MPLVNVCFNTHITDILYNIQHCQIHLLCPLLTNINLSYFPKAARVLKRIAPFILTRTDNKQV